MNPVRHSMKYSLCALLVATLPHNAMAQSRAATGAPVEDADRSSGLSTAEKIGIGLGIAWLVYQYVQGGGASSSGSSFSSGVPSPGTYKPYIYRETIPVPTPEPVPVTPPVSPFYGCSDGRSSC